VPRLLFVVLFEVIALFRCDEESALHRGVPGDARRRELVEEERP
jgi:hypothetical protein